MQKLKSCVVAGFVSVCALPGVAGDLANGDEIMKLLNGNTLMGAGAGFTFAEYYDPDGTIRGDGYAAKWKVEGDTGCMDYDGNGFKCWTMEIVEGPAHVWYLDGEVSAAAMVVEGNPKEF